MNIYRPRLRLAALAVLGLSWSLMVQATEIEARRLPSLIPDAPVEADLPAPSSASPRVKHPPPPPSACVSEAEYNDAMMGSGCDCSCEGYAQGPERRCAVVCGLSHYGCWAPDPTDAEIAEHSRAAFADSMGDLPPEARTALEAELATVMASNEWKDSARGALMLQRADEWDQARRCAAN